ncbi:3-dehydroquinate synthase, partial [Staphylococcus aureus]|nr:3-dehydroquinate synthase [Staphylococcus aureus]
MKLQTTYPSNNYPIYVEHGAIDHISTFLHHFPLCFFFISFLVYHYFSNLFDYFFSFYIFFKF